MIIHKAEATHYSEIPQTSSTKFSFVNKQVDGSFKELFYKVKCRDFLGDCVYTNVTGKPLHVYGFTFGNNKLDVDATRLLVYFDKTDEYNNFQTGIKELHAIEQMTGLQLTTIEEVEKNVLLVQGDPHWQSSIWAISLYTFLIRLYSYTNQVAPLDSNEAVYSNQLGKNLDKLYANLKQMFRYEAVNPTGWNTDNSSQIHNASGFVSLFKQHFPDNVFSDYFHKHIKEAA